MQESHRNFEFQASWAYSVGYCLNKHWTITQPQFLVEALLNWFSKDKVILLTTFLKLISNWLPANCWL